jgi:hypothetical protein
VIAIAIKELLEAVKALGRGGFGFPHRDRALLSSVIRDLLSQDPNIPRVEATLKEVESLGTRPSADYYVAKSLLTQVQRALARSRRDARLTRPMPGGPGASRSFLTANPRASGAGLTRRARRSDASLAIPISRPDRRAASRTEKIRARDNA